MFRENLHQPFDISFGIHEPGAKPLQRYSFFELVFVLSGKGTQRINDSSFKFGPNHMFLLTPDDRHSFELEVPTQLFFLRFNDIYLRDGGIPADQLQRLEYMLQNANHEPGCVLKNQTDKLLVRPVVEAIMREIDARDLHNREIVHQLVGTLIVIVARNIAKFLPQPVLVGQESKALELLNFVQANIYEPAHLRTGYLSRKFNISEAYIGRYFKRHTNETLQEYISTYRSRLIQHRLRFSDKRINEIAAEFGFTDESHLTKFFRKRHGYTPKQYRTQLMSAGPASSC